MNSEYDMAIIGAGPAGSFCAYLLSQSGFKVVLIDHNKTKFSLDFDHKNLEFNSCHQQKNLFKKPQNTCVF